MTNRYRYRALDAQGAEISGLCEAADARGAIAALTREGLTLLDIAAHRVRPVAIRGRISTPDRAVLLHEIATLLGAGVPLAEALESLAQAYAETPLGALLGRLRRDIAGGQSVGPALRQCGLQLPEYVGTLVEAGEASGRLAPAFAAAAAHLDHEHRVLVEVRQALIYPAVLVAAGIFAVLLVFLGVVPRFGPLIAGNRAADIPDISRWVIGAGIYLKQHLGLFAAAAGAALAAAAGVLLQPRMRSRLVGALVALPVVGVWWRQAEVGRWARLCGTLLDNRVPLVRALELSLPALRLPALRRQIADAPALLGRGQSLTEILRKTGWLPPQRLNLIRVGERSGELPRMLLALGEMQAEAARGRLRQMLALLEPVAILGIGVVIGGVMIAVILAITGINTMR